MKHIRDEVAEFVCETKIVGDTLIADDADPNVCWIYRQEESKDAGVIVDIIQITQKELEIINGDIYEYLQSVPSDLA